MNTTIDKTTDETRIRELIDARTQAIGEKDIDAVMGCYAPGVVAFDIPPPLRFAGAEAYRASWEMGFQMMKGPIEQEVRDLKIAVGDDVAFAHYLFWMKSGDGGEGCGGGWVRWTIGFQKTDGAWRIAHEHVSVPFDIESGKALFDLQPE